MWKRTTVYPGLEPWFWLCFYYLNMQWEHGNKAEEWVERGIKGIFLNS